uniref:putative F-box protein At1g47790 n=1 Tax=Erigeron canadensis TaxID=72917 RepID=UPI001CB92EA3|nr:putative F-box protein At1g47790 [Erigeron canadensis]
MKKITSNSDDTIPFDTQVEILKKLPVKPLIKFRSVSKEYKSLIDSRIFIAEYGSRETHPNRLLVRYTQHKTPNVENYVCFLDNDDSNFTQQEFAPRIPNALTKLLNRLRIVGTSHGLLCFYGFNYSSNENNMIILWNPSIRTSFGITLPGELGWSCKDNVIGFGVCPVTSDPIVVKSRNLDGWEVEIFTLSTGIWKRVPSTNIPSRESAELTWHQIVINKLIYFLAYDKTVAVEPESDKTHIDESDDFLNLIVSFDMTTNEFTILDLPNNLAYRSEYLSMSKIRESLVVLEYNWDTYKSDCVVWMMMEQGVRNLFTKLFTINEDVCSVVGFMKNGDPMIVTEDNYDHSEPTALKVYDRCSQHFKQLGIYGEEDSFFMGSYVETLLLLDHPDCFI